MRVRIHGLRPTLTGLLKSRTVSLLTLSPAAAELRRTSIFSLSLSLSTCSASSSVSWRPLTRFTFFYIISNIVSSEIRLWMAEPCLPLSAGRVQHGLHKQRVNCKSVIVSVCSGDQKWQSAMRCFCNLCLWFESLEVEARGYRLS